MPFIFSVRKAMCLGIQSRLLSELVSNYGSTLLSYNRNSKSIAMGYTCIYLTNHLLLIFRLFPAFSYCTHYPGISLEEIPMSNGLNFLNSSIFFIAVFKW